ncbi:MAG: serine/threonine-protein kinase [Burkholderiales bacterium]
MADLQQLGKYKVIEVLGKGAMGVVYKGFDPLIERYVALKTVRKDLVDRDLAAQIVARFKNEAQAAGRLTHPGVVAVYEYGEDKRTAYIAMEFVQGRGLRDFLARHERFGLQEIMSIMSQLLEALDYAHQHGVVHRDIKPANIIMMADGRLKVADFGIARIDRSSLTAVGSVMGTPSYMSPEQYAGLPVDGRSDIFSTGVVLYELLTGTKPFEGATETIAYKICHEQHRNPSEINPQGVPPVFDAILARALAKKAEQRFSTAREFAATLLSAYEKRGSATLAVEATVLNTRLPQAPERPDTTFPPPGWETGDLRAVEELLAPHVGPMAKVLVKKAAKATTDARQLVDLLAENISDGQKKQVFVVSALGKVPRTAGSAATAERGVPGPAIANLSQQPIDPGEIEKAAGRLARYLGPIAKVVAKRAASQTNDLKTLYLRLAENLSDPEERARFLKDAGYG